MILQSYHNQNSLVLTQSRYMYQWNRIENSEINLYTYSQVIFNRGGKNMQR